MSGLPEQLVGNVLTDNDTEVQRPFLLGQLVVRPASAPPVINVREKQKPVPKFVNDTNSDESYRYTLEYYNYYHSLRPPDPRLPVPLTWDHTSSSHGEQVAEPDPSGYHASPPMVASEHEEKVDQGTSQQEQPQRHDNGERNVQKYEPKQKHSNGQNHYKNNRMKSHQQKNGHMSHAQMHYQYQNSHPQRTHATVGYENYISLQTSPDHFTTQHSMYLPPHLAHINGGVVHPSISNVPHMTTFSSPMYPQPQDADPLASRMAVMTLKDKQMSDSRNMPDVCIYQGQNLRSQGMIPGATPMNMNQALHPNINLSFGINPNMGQQMLTASISHNMSYNTMGHIPPNPANYSVPGGIFPPPHGGYSMGMGMPNSPPAMNHPLMVPYPAPIRAHDHKAPNSMYYTASENGREHGMGGSPGHSTGSQTKPNRYSYPQKGAPVRSPLLEEFRNTKNNRKFELKDLTDHFVEFSGDQHGSRFIQQKLESAGVAEKNMVFKEILPHAHALMIDVFGNYVIQKFFDHGTPEQKRLLGSSLTGQVLTLSLQMYGCRVVQKALEVIPPEQQALLVKELEGHVMQCIKDQNGNHVIQKVIEQVPPHLTAFIIDTFTNKVLSLATHPYGCRVIQRILEHHSYRGVLARQHNGPPPQIVQELLSYTLNLIQDQYGNYVIQHLIVHGSPADQNEVATQLRGKILQLSQHKFASNVVEKCVQYGTDEHRRWMILEICADPNGLEIMMKDQYANYVIQKILDVCDAQSREILITQIRPHIASLKTFTYGKHIIARLEKIIGKIS